MTTVPVVIVVDDDPLVRSSLRFLIGSIGLPVERFDSTKALLQRKLPDAPSLPVLDVRLRVLSSPDFQRELAARNCRMPIIFITGHGDIPMSVRAMKARENVKRASPIDQDCAEDKFEEITGMGTGLKFVLSEVQRVAPTDSTVLILGETGSGKERIAGAIHKASTRRIVRTELRGHSLRPVGKRTVRI